MIFTDKTILAAIEKGDIVINPFVRENLGTNSVDLTLSPKILTYDQGVNYTEFISVNEGSDIIDMGMQSDGSNLYKRVMHEYFIDSRAKNETTEMIIPEDGFIMEPGQLYIASTNEYTETFNAVPKIEGKCFQKGTQIVMFDETLKNIEDIVVGDLVLGLDGKSKEVVSTHSGIDKMYEVSSGKADTYYVNKQHELVLESRGNTENKKYPKGIVVVSVNDFINLSKNVRSKLRSVKKPIPYKEKNLLIDPYILGVWLGDGTAENTNITINSVDYSIIDYIVSKYPLTGIKKYKENCYTINVTDNPKDSFVQENSFLNSLRYLGLINNKRIPDVYKKSSIDQRVGLISGLIDTDGYLNRNIYEITQKRKNLILDIKDVCDSLGFYCYLSEKKVNGVVYYRLTISGDTDILKLRVERKQIVSKLIGQKGMGNVSIKEVEETNYYGFELSGSNEFDKMFFLKDGLVVHNSSLGRLGLWIHVTAGYGDVGFCGTWTLELVCVVPLKIYPNMKICQISYHGISEIPLVAYNQKSDAKYSGQDGPTSSKNYNNFIQ